jgi:hypothetical protein
MRRSRRRGLFWIWLVAAILLTVGWWTLYGRFLSVSNLHLQLLLYHGVPILMNLALANRLGLLGPRTSAPGTVGMVLASICLPYILLALLLTLGCAIAQYFGVRGACL